MSFERLTREQHLQIYREMYRPRKVDEAIRNEILRPDGNIPLALLSIGQEAVAVGVSFDLVSGRDALFFGHRDKGALLHMGITALEDISNHMGKASSPMRGRDNNIHYAFWGKNEEGCERYVGKFTSHMGAGWPTAAGVAKGWLYDYLELSPEEQAKTVVPFVLCMCGDGASRQGIVHEVMNTAALYNLPMGFVFVNNGIATQTPINEQVASPHLYTLGNGYHIATDFVSSGNNVIDVYDAAAPLIARARRLAAKKEFLEENRLERAPFLLECRTFRMTGHNEKQLADCVDLYEYAKWRAQDPLTMYRSILLNYPRVEALLNIKSRDHIEIFNCTEKEFTVEELDRIEQEVREEVEVAYQAAKAMPEPQPDKSLLQIYPSEIVFPKTRAVEPFNAKTLHDRVGKEKRWLNGNRAMRKVVVDLMKEYPKILLFGEDVGGRKIEGELRGGGVYNISHDALLDPTIGPKRVFNTSLAENSIIGLMIGLSLTGKLPFAEIQYLPFLSVALSGAIDYLPSWFWTAGVPIHAVLRLPCGGGHQSGEFHSSMRLEPVLYHTPGLKLLTPSTPNDIMGLMKSAAKDDSPIMFFENLWGFSEVYGEISGNEVPIGPAALRQEGKDITIIAWGAKTWFDAVLPAVKKLEENGLSAELIDLRTLRPLDMELMVASARKTHRVLIVHEDICDGGIGQSIAYKINLEASQEMLCAPLVVASEYCPSPQHRNLENWFLPSTEKVMRAINDRMEWR
ncbi:MAG: hypothetical protein HYT12_03510 [Candidatus Liptonbacteria bacterium]|nr:hypothetical protein [Candidatus Liptonbacteria bacterium]